MLHHKRPKLLVTGISGFLGGYIAPHPQEQWQIIGQFYKKAVSHADIEMHTTDLSKEEEIASLLKVIQPDAILHLAALSNANYCEHHPEESRAINYQAGLHFAQYAKEKAIPYLFTSTDLVFDGTQAPYTVSDAPTPISVYGQDKADCEKAILDLYPEAIIARLPVMYGLKSWSPCFMNHWLKNLQEGKEVGAFTDEYRTTASGASVVEGLFLLLEKKVRGIWHLGGAEQWSRYDFAVEMAKAFGLPSALVKATKQAEITMPAARPANVSLDSEPSFALGFQPESVLEDLAKSTI